MHGGHEPTKALAALIGANIAPLGLHELVHRLSGYMNSEDFGLTAYGLHVQNLNLARVDAGYRRVLANAATCYPDGNSVRLVAAAFGIKLPERIVTTDLIWPVLEQASKFKRSVFFLGGHEGLASAAATAAKSRLPDLTIAGCSTGYFPDNQAAHIAAQIRSTSAHLVLVAMGVPREQIFCDQFGQSTGAHLLMTAGGLFGFMKGDERRAPRLLRDAGLEWTWRLGQNPARLAGRYATGVLTVMQLSSMGLIHRLAH